MKSKIEKYVDAFLISTLAYLLQPFKKSYKAEYTLLNAFYAYEIMFPYVIYISMSFLSIDLL